MQKIDLSKVAPAIAFAMMLAAVAIGGMLFYNIQHRPVMTTESDPLATTGHGESGSRD
jgi:hypothetical protein